MARSGQGADFVIGSSVRRRRLLPTHSGTVSWLNSRVATWLARPFTSARIRWQASLRWDRSTFEQASSSTPIGYKIGLELMVKSIVGRLAEIPFTSPYRQIGESKLSLQEQLKYLAI